MALPFTIEQFLGIMGNYNETVFPAQILLVLVALSALYFLFRKETQYSGKIVFYALAFLWLWAGIVYHILFFTEINKAAYVFGGLFVIEAILLGMIALKNKAKFDTRLSLKTFLGGAFILYALVLYPILNYVFGHVWPTIPSFGLPCPVTIFTFGILMFLVKIPKYVLIIPMLWALIGISAAINLGVWEDLMIIVAGITATMFAFIKHKKR